MFNGLKCLNGGTVNEFLELARNYRQTAEAILESALNSGEPREWGYPVLFAYRHTLELYLKIIGEIEEDTQTTCRSVRWYSATDQGADFRGSRPKRGSRVPSRPAGFFVGVSALDLTLEIGTFRMMESTLKSRDELRTTTFMEGLLHSS